MTPLELNSIGVLFVPPGAYKWGSTLIGGRSTTFELHPPPWWFSKDTRVPAKKLEGSGLFEQPEGAMLRAGNFGSVAVAIPRSDSGGGAPPRLPARPFFPDWVVLSRRRGAVTVSGASLGQRSRVGSKREPDSQLLLGTQMCISGLESNCEAEVVAEGPGLALPATSSRGIPSVHGVCLLVYRVFFGTDVCVHDHNALQRRFSLSSMSLSRAAAQTRGRAGGSHLPTPPWTLARQRTSRWGAPGTLGPCQWVAPGPHWANLKTGALQSCIMTRIPQCGF